MPVNFDSMSEDKSLLGDVESLIEGYALLDPRKSRSATEIVRSMQRDASRVLFPLIAGLEERARRDDSDLDSFIRGIASQDQLRYREADQEVPIKAARASSIALECESLEKELNSLQVGTPKWRRVLKSLELRTVELDLINKRLSALSGELQQRIDRTQGLVSALEPTYRDAKNLRTGFFRFRVQLSAWLAFSYSVWAFPTIIALITTIFVDRITPKIESLAGVFRLHHPHDLTILILFSIQVAVFTFVIDRISIGLAYAAFERTLNTFRLVRSHAADVSSRLEEFEREYTHVRLADQTLAN